MTISSEVRTAGPYSGSGVAATFPFNFKVFDQDDLLVVLNAADLSQTTLVRASDYTVTLNADQDVSPGGSITTVAAVDVGETLLITSNLDLTQPLDLTNAGGFFPDNIEDALDRLTILIQQAGGPHVIKGPIGEVNATLPPASQRINKLLGFDASGQPIALVTPDAAGATALDLSLRSTTVAGQGAGQVGFGALNYTLQTVGRALMDGGPSVNAYPGVDPTGVGDSTTAINAAIAAWSALGVKVIRLTGIYATTAALAFANNIAYAITGTINSTSAGKAIALPDNAVNIQIDGFGVGKIAGTFERGISSVNSSTATNIRIERIEVTGATRTGTSYTSAIFIDGGSRIHLERNYCHGNGIGVSTATGNADILVYAAQNAYVMAVGNHCLSTDVGFNLAIFNTTDWHAHFNTLGGAKCGASDNNGYGLLIYSATPEACKRGSSLGNIIRDTGGSGIYYQDCVDFTSIGNECYDVAKTQGDTGLPVGGVAYNGCTNAVSRGDNVNKSGKDGIVTTGSVGVDIDAVVIDCAGHGFHLRGTGNGTRVRGRAENCSSNLFSDTTAKSDLDIEITSIGSKTGTNGIDCRNISGSRIAGVSSRNARAGVLVNAGDGNVIAVTCLDNSAETANTYDGVVNGSTNTRIIGCRSGNTAATGQRYGITSSADGCDIDNNNCTRNQTDGLNLSGSNISHDGNRVSTSATPGPLQGNATLTAGVVDVTTDEVRSSDFIELQRVTPGGGIAGHLTYTIVNATKFTVTASTGAATVATDIGAFNWRIRH